MTEDKMVIWHHWLNGYSGLISFRIDWFDLHAVQGILKSLLQHHSLKASILWCSAFFSSSLLSAIKGGVICISEVTDIFPSNLDSSLCIIQSGILHDVLCI